MSIQASLSSIKNPTANRRRSRNTLGLIREFPYTNSKRPAHFTTIEPVPRALMLNPVIALNHTPMNHPPTPYLQWACNREVHTNNQRKKLWVFVFLSPCLILYSQLLKWWRTTWIRSMNVWNKFALPSIYITIHHRNTSLLRYLSRQSLLVNSAQVYPFF